MRLPQWAPDRHEIPATALIHGATMNDKTHVTSFEYIRNNGIRSDTWRAKCTRLAITAVK